MSRYMLWSSIAVCSCGGKMTTMATAARCLSRQCSELSAERCAAKCSCELPACSSGCLHAAVRCDSVLLFYPYDFTVRLTACAKALRAGVRNGCRMLTLASAACVVWC